MADIKGDPMVNPDEMTCNGHPILGWAHGKWVGKKFFRRALELFRPKRLEPGDEAVPLVDGRRVTTGLPEPKAAPPMPPVAPAKAEIPAELLARRVAKLAELRRTCNINRNMGQTMVPIEFVLKCLNDD